MTDDQRSEGADQHQAILDRLDEGVERVEAADAAVEEHKLLGAADILDADDIKTQRVPVPEWGGDVLVKTLTGKERDAFESTIVDMKLKGKDRQVNLENFRAKLVIASLVDEAGNKLFSPKQLEQLAQKSAAALHRCFKVAQEMSGFGEDDVEELTSEMGKDQSSDSGTDSQLT